MSCDENLRRKIPQTTLDEVILRAPTDSDPCVICLEQVQDVAVALPCGHKNFDFICLLSWLEHRRTCPLCQVEITGARYDVRSSTGPRTYYLPSLPELIDPTIGENPFSNQTTGHRPGRRSRPQDPASTHPPEQLGYPLDRRRYVYTHRLYSHRVGTNPLSQYRELTPRLFNWDETLETRARKWIRRELQVFAFLDGHDREIENQTQSRDASSVRVAGRTRRARNAEFLLEYIIAILRTVDIKGSSGQAEEILQEFIGRENTRLFLHELQSWLRSPFDSLHDWDKTVQYGERAEQSPPTIHREGAIPLINRRQL